MRIPLSPTQAPALAIAVFVRKRGAAYSAEVLNAFDITESTLRRRRPALRKMGIEFVRRDRGSYYTDPNESCELRKAPNATAKRSAAAVTIRPGALEPNGLGV